MSSGFARFTLLLPVFLFATPACSMSASADASSASPEAGLEPTTTRSLDRLAASFSAQSDGTSLHVYAALVGSGFLRVQGSDTLHAIVNGSDVALVERIETINGEKRVHYVAELASPPPEPDVSIVFARSGTAYASNVKLAANFDVLGTPASFKVGDQVRLRLTPQPKLGASGPQQEWTGTSIAIQVQSACITGGASSVIDPGDGTFVWDTSTLVVDSTSAGDCDLEVDVRLGTLGVVAKELGSANVFHTGEGLQHRTFRTILKR